MVLKRHVPDCNIGWTDINVNAFDGESGIDYVEFFIGGESKAKVAEGFSKPSIFKYHM